MSVTGGWRYTQHSVAFPNVPMRDHVTDEVLVEFPSGAGIAFRWYELGGGEPAVRVDAFRDGFAGLTSDRVQRVLARLAPDGDVGPSTPSDLVELLEAEGFSPSGYHLEGLVKHGSLTVDEMAALQRRIETERMGQA